MARKKKVIDDLYEYDDELENEVKAWNDVSDEIELDVAPTEQASYNNTVKLRSKIGARFTYPGKVTGKLYVWERAGTIVEVDELDAPDLLSKKLGDGPCCGSSHINYVFEIMKE